MATMANSPKPSRRRKREAVRLRRRKHSFDHNFDEADEFDVELLALGAVDENGRGQVSVSLAPPRLLRSLPSPQDRDSHLLNLEQRLHGGAIPTESLPRAISPSVR
jgi:hypothetical protein